MKIRKDNLLENSLITLVLAATLAGCDGQDAKSPEQTIEPPKLAEVNPTLPQPAAAIIEPSSAAQPVSEPVAATVPQPDCPYETSLEAGIDFGKSCWPDILTKVEGVSEPYWSKPFAMRSSDAIKAPGIKLTFTQDLPPKFELVIDGFALPKNSGKPVLVRIGKTVKQFIYKKEYKFGSQDRPYEEILIEVELDAPANTIEIVPPNPITYRQAGYPDDSKSKWGIGVRSIRIIRK